jgi:hypothetical protein
VKQPLDRAATHNVTRGASLLAVAVLVLGIPLAGRTTATRAKPHTLVVAHGQIYAFAQDTSTIAWIDSGYRVHVNRLGAQRGSVIGSALHGGGHKAKTYPLALAGIRALWTSYDRGNFLYTYVYTGSPTLAEREIAELVYMPDDGPGGTYLSGVAGDGATLALGTTGQHCDDDYNCRRIDVDGAVRRVNTDARDIPGIPPSVMLATSSSRIALVPAKTPRFYPDLGPPRAAEYAPVQVFDLAGHLISSVVPPGTPRAIALSWPKLAVLFEFVDGSRQIQLYDARTGGYWTTREYGGVFTKVPVTVKRVAVGPLGAVYAVGGKIYLLRQQKPQFVWRASGTPIGLSIEGRRIAWAVNLKGRGRIVALTLPGVAATATAV